VLLEKPMALHLGEAQAIVRAARARRKVVTVYQPARLGAAHQQLLRLIGSGRIGPVVRVQAGLFSYVRRNDWQALRRYGGGMLSNYGAHAIDEVLALIGYDVRRIFCQLQRVATLGDADDAVKVVLQTRTGVLGDVDISQASAISPWRIIVWGRYGAIRQQGDVFHLRYLRPEKLPPRTLNRSLASAGRKYPTEDLPFIEEEVKTDPALAVDVYADLAQAIREGTPPYVRPEATLAVMRVIERCRRDTGGVSEMRR